MSKIANHNKKFLKGFSRLSSNDKARVVSRYMSNPAKFRNELSQHRHPDENTQNMYQEFSENTLSNFFLPYSIAPNFLINKQLYHVPMVIEESSVVAAAAGAAKFWSVRGGFHSRVLNTLKKGQIHFQWLGNPEKLISFFNTVKNRLLKVTESFSVNMKRRGGGITNIKLLHLPEVLENYYQLDVDFGTVDAMGANFINSSLELLGTGWKELVRNHSGFPEEEQTIDLLMAILSNYTPDCIVECFVESRLSELTDAASGWSGQKFADRFIKAVTIAAKDVNRAVTHNKGIFNGIDAVMLATGNDFRAVEANGHAYASRSGRYTSLSDACIRGNNFNFRLELPLNVGTVGGVTRLHPMANNSLEILGWPTAKELMEITASAGLANNFSAIKSLISTGIQSGHMKLHLSNILNQLGASKEESKSVSLHFEGKVISYQSVREYVMMLRED